MIFSIEANLVQLTVNSYTKVDSKVDKEMLNKGL